jgi:hypothetical protein
MPDKGELEITIIAEAKIWMVVLANIRLSLRHPGNSGVLAEIGRDFADQLEDKLVEEGVYSAEDIAQLRRQEMRAQN